MLYDFPSLEPPLSVHPLVASTVSVMAPTSTSTSTSTASATMPRRQSCDRCHGQKLRCTRTGNGDRDACNRCFRQGVQCVYSSSLPKGRPSMYRLADISSSKSRAVTPITSESRRQHSVSPHTQTAHANANGNGNGNVNANANAKANVMEDVLLAEPMDTSMWPWTAPLNWNDLQLGESKHDSSQWTSNLHTMDHPQNDTGTAFLDSFQSATDWSPTANSEGGGSAPGGLLSPPRIYDHSPSLGIDLFDSNGGITTPAIDKNGPDAGIAQLSQLSTRLYPLHRSSCALAESGGSLAHSKGRNPARQSPLIDDDAFKSVAVWLVHASFTMD